MTTEDFHLTREIVAAIRGGDRGAFDTLFTRVGGEVYVYIYNRMGERLRGIMEAEDVLQEVYTQAYETFADFADRGSGSMKRWLIAMAQNQIRRFYNHYFEVQKRDPGREVLIELHGDGTRGGVEPGSPEPTPSRVVAGDEEVQRIARAVDALQPDLRELILQHVYEGQSIAHIAEERGTPRTTLNYRLTLAHQQLRAILGPRRGDAARD